MQDVSWDQDDPVNRVYFYKKETPWKAVRGGKLFDSMVHNADQQTETFSPNPKRSDLGFPGNLRKTKHWCIVKEGKDSQYKCISV